MLRGVPAHPAYRVSHTDLKQTDGPVGVLKNVKRGALHGKSRVQNAAQHSCCRLTFETYMCDEFSYHQH